MYRECVWGCVSLGDKPGTDLGGVGVGCLGNKGKKGL